MNQSELARRISRSQAWMNARWLGKTVIDMDDLEVIADGLGVDPRDLMPRELATAGRYEVRHQGLEPRTRWFGRTGERRGYMPIAYPGHYPARRRVVVPLAEAPARQFVMIGNEAAA